MKPLADRTTLARTRAAVAGLAYAITLLQASGSGVAADPSTDSLHRRAPLKAEVRNLLRESFDAGDAFPTPNGERLLRRLSGAVAVKAVGPEFAAALKERLTAVGGPLAPHVVYADFGGGITLFKRTSPVVSGVPEQLAAQDQVLTELRNDPSTEFAQPVFVGPGSGVLMVPLQEIIVRLKPDVVASNYLAADWSRTRPLPGTTDQFIIQFPGATAEEIFDQTRTWAADANVVWAQPNFVQQKKSRLTPTDTYFAQQWYLNNVGQGGGVFNADMNLAEAWNLTTGRTNIVIAILDDAIELTHPDLAANLFINPGDPTVNGSDDDGNGYIDDRRGWDFDTDDNNPGPNSDESHGTACAGLAAAVGNNSLGIAGVAFGCKVLPVKYGVASDSATAAAFYYVAGRARNGVGAWRGADVISTSMNWEETPAVNDAIHWAATQGRSGKGCPVLVASGNDASGWYYWEVPVSAGTHTFTFEYYKDASTSEGEDTVWLDEVYFPGVGTERFESASWPSGWTHGGQAWWTLTTRPDRAYGTGFRTAQSGNIGDNQRSTLQVTRTVAAGYFSFMSWTSTELDYDTLDIYVDNHLEMSDWGGVNSYTLGLSYPASHPDVLGVGASTDFDYRSDYSQYGDGLDFLAPSGGGVAYVYTLDRVGTAGYNTNPAPAGNYTMDFSGTSASTPLAAGVAALVLSANCDLTAAQVTTILRNTCAKIGQVPYVSGWNSYYGYGRLNAYAAVSQAVVPTGLFNPVRQGSSFQVSIQSQACRTYVLEYKDTLDAGAWASLPGVPGNGSVLTLVDSSAGVLQRFYRVSFR